MTNNKYFLSLTEREKDLMTSVIAGTLKTVSLELEDARNSILSKLDDMPDCCELRKAAYVEIGDFSLTFIKK